MRWLADHLGYKQHNQWYGITCKEFMRTGGHRLLAKYPGLSGMAVMDLVPARNWQEWRFVRVPEGFWDSAANRHRYLRWLGRELGFRRADWYRISCDDINDRYGAALFTSSLRCAT